MIKLLEVNIGLTWIFERSNTKNEHHIFYAMDLSILSMGLRALRIDKRAKDGK